MEKQEDNDSQKDKVDAEKLKSYIDDMVKGQKAPVAKDLVTLKHVETKKQTVSQETKNLADAIKEIGAFEEKSDELTNDELTILESFEKKRLFLSRIAIIVNQSRVMIGMEGFKKAELEDILNNLIAKGYLDSQVVNENIVYILTEKGEERIQ
ncbi:MAG: hypothetical protein ACFFBP_13865 [Promethearchaeota archaeon]